MDIVSKIRAVCAIQRVSEAELARRIGTSPSAFNQRMKTGKFTSEELDKIAAALGVTYVCYFELPDGTKQ